MSTHEQLMQLRIQRNAPHKKAIELETFTLRGKGYYCRPAGSLGSIGWSPFPWTMAWGSTEQAARTNFKQLHKTHQPA